MQTSDTLYTPTEAAVLTRLPLKAVNNAIDKKMIETVAGERAGRSTRLLDAQALMSLAVERRLADRLAPELRRELFGALAKAPRDIVALQGGFLLLDALFRCTQSDIASFAVVVDAIDAAARAFYLHESFLPLPNQPRRLFRRMSDIEALFNQVD